MRFPGNRTHVIVVAAIREGALPLLFVDSEDGGCVMREQVALVRHLAAQGFSPSQQLKLTESIGRFCDWVALAETSPPRTADTLPAILRRFLVARYDGTILNDGTDPTGLYWQPVKSQTVEMDRRHLNTLSDFVAREFGYYPLNPSIRCDPYRNNTAAYQAASLVLSSRRRQMDLLGHIAHKRAPRVIRAIGPITRQSVKRLGDGQTFPIETLIELICQEHSVVKRMIYIELAFGGIRISEALNHFITDVLPGRHRPNLFPDDQPSNQCLVVLADPVDGIYTDSLALTSENRRQFLYRRYQLIPRSMRPQRGDPLHAGWKGMSYDNSNLLMSQVYWSNPDWARIYWRLYGELLDIRRSVPRTVRDSHPYLYINDSLHRTEFGQPVKIHTIEKAFARACERIGLQPYRSGASLHGLRHAYKRQLRFLGVQPGIIQRCMHHATPESQLVYDHATAADINAALLAKRGCDVN